MSRKRYAVTKNGLRWSSVFVLALVCGAGAQRSAAQGGDESGGTAPSVAEISEERRMNLLMQGSNKPSVTILDDSQISKEREMKLLQLREALLQLKTAETVYNREINEYAAMKAMYDDEIVSGKMHQDALREFEQAETTYEQARIELDRTKLNFLQDATRISIVKAAKFTDEDNQLWMEFTIKNSSNVEQAIVTSDDELHRDLLEARLTVENIVINVSVKGVNIGEPVELRVPKLGYGKQYTGRFLLRTTMEETENVTLNMAYLGTSHNEQVYLTKESGDDIIQVVCLQPALEGTLRNEVQFSMRFDRLAEDEKTFALMTIGLPKKIRHSFDFDRRRVSQLKFSRRDQSYDPVALECFVPEDIPEDELDVPIPFYVVVADSAGVKRVQELELELGDKLPTSEQLSRLKVGFERLQLIPKGFGEMQIRVANALLQVTQGEDAEALIEIQNTGRVELLAVRVIVDPPPGWEITREPSVIERVGIQDREPMRLYINLPDDIEVGQHEMRVDAQCDYRGEQIEAVAKNIKIDVEARARLMLNSLLAAALLLAVIGVAVFTIRVARR